MLENSLADRKTTLAVAEEKIVCKRGKGLRRPRPDTGRDLLGRVETSNLEIPERKRRFEGFVALRNEETVNCASPRTLPQIDQGGGMYLCQECLGHYFSRRVGISGRHLEGPRNCQDCGETAFIWVRLIEEDSPWNSVSALAPLSASVTSQPIFSSVKTVMHSTGSSRSEEALTLALAPRLKTHSLYSLKLFANEPI
jgi:hypothetical protein